MNRGYRACGGVLEVREGAGGPGLGPGGEAGWGGVGSVPDCPAFCPWDLPSPCYFRVLGFSPWASFLKMTSWGHLSPRKHPPRVRRPPGTPVRRALIPVAGGSLEAGLKPRSPVPDGGTRAGGQAFWPGALTHHTTDRCQGTFFLNKLASHHPGDKTHDYIIPG